MILPQLNEAYIKEEKKTCSIELNIDGRKRKCWHARALFIQNSSHKGHFKYLINLGRKSHDQMSGQVDLPYTTSMIPPFF